MARGATAGPPGPPSAKAYRVDSSSRIRIDSDQLELLVPWLTGETVERVAVPGPRGGIIVTTTELLHEAIETLHPNDLAEEAASSRRADYARFLGMRWPLTFSFEQLKDKGRYTITLPEGARHFGILPSEEGMVVVFISGGIVELWDKNQWIEYRRSLGFTVEGILEDLR